MTDDVVKKLKKMRYRWFTSSSEDGGTSATNVPFWGMPGTKFSDVVYATEGGLKAATAQSISGGCFVAIPGVTCYIDLSGQWAIDVMQNGDDFWIIDMSLAQNSALNECIPESLRKPLKENWIPTLCIE